MPRLFIAIPLLFFATTSYATDWVKYLNASSNSTNAYFDADSIMVGSRTRTVAVKDVFSETVTLPHSGKQFRVTRYLVEINCNERKFRFLATGHSMSENNNDGYVMSAYYPEDPWVPIVAGRDESKLAIAVCSKQFYKK